MIILRNYIDKTAQWCGASSNAIFLSLKSPHVAIEPTTVSEILQQAIRLNFVFVISDAFYFIFLIILILFSSLIWILL